MAGWEGKDGFSRHGMSFWEPCTSQDGVDEKEVDLCAFKEELRYTAGTGRGIATPPDGW